jgi:ADP-ribose pyrophosphatase YjhB (NUDIX family)
VHANNRLVKAGGWADPPDCVLLKQEWRRRVTFESNWCFDPEGRPLNPRGRTGMCERGLLGKWGANQAADPIVTRLQPETARLQVVAVLRKDTGDWALPGGMVDDAEVVSVTVRREFAEEVGAIEDELERRKFTEMVDELFVTGQARMTCACACACAVTLAAVPPSVDPPPPHPLHPLIKGAVALIHPSYSSGSSRVVRDDTRRQVFGWLVYRHVPPAPRP